MRTLRIRCLSLGLALLGALGLTAGPTRAEAPVQPPVFSAPLEIDNAYLPFHDHRIRLYRRVHPQPSGAGGKFVLDVFTGHQRTFAWDGQEVVCAELEEWEIEACEIVEISRNYFAQADDGTVWYFGEVVDEYEDGAVVAHGGSWLVGGPGADDPEETVTADEPTVFMPGNPEVGDTWKAEDLPAAGIEEFDEVVRILRRLRVPAGSYEAVVQVREETPDVGYKWYAPGVGFVKEKDADEAVALVAILDHDDAEARQERLDELLEDLLCEDDQD